MSFHPYERYKILIDPKSKKTQGLRIGDIVRRQYFDNPNLIYSLMAVLETGVDVIAGEDSNYFIGALLEGDPPKNGEILDFVRVTSLSDPDRGGALYLTASDSDAPFMDVIDGLAQEKSLLYPISFDYTNNKATKNLYSCIQSKGIEYTYKNAEYDVYRILRMRKMDNTVHETAGIFQRLTSVPEYPGRLLISFRARASKECEGIEFNFGYSDGTENEGNEIFNLKRDWEYKFFLVNIDYPAQYERCLSINATSALKEIDDWLEIGDLNIVELSSVANFSLGTKARVGKIKGIIDPIFGVLDGYGAYFQNVYATRNINIAGTLTAGDENGFSSTFYVGKIHKNVIENSLDCKTIGSVGQIDEPSPAGIGNVLQFGFEDSLILQSNEWLKKHHNNGYCFSFWAKSDKSVTVKLYQNDHYVGSLEIEDKEFRRYNLAFILNGDTEEDLILKFEFSNIPFYLSAPQLEAGNKPTPYQPTDGTLSYTEDYGAWFNKGGIGGTIQNPLLKLNSDGSISSGNNSFVIKPDGTGYFANGRFTWTHDTITLQDVTIRWEDLSEDARENLQNRSVEISGTTTFHYPDELDTTTVEPEEILLLATERNFTSISRQWLYLDSYGIWKGIIGANKEHFLIKPDGHYWEDRNVLTVKYSSRFNLVDYENQFTISKLFDGESTYSIYISSSNGNVFRNGIIGTTLQTFVYRGGEDITSKIPDNNFKWIKCSNNPESDKIFNDKDYRGKSLTITGDDVDYKAVFDCEVLISTK